MKSLWTLLLLLCTCDPGMSDCQRDCLSCSLLFPEKQSFSSLVCLVECESKDSPALTWELCRQHVEQSHSSSWPAGGTMLKRAEEEVAAVLPANQGDGGLLYSEALQRFDHVARALGTAQLSASYGSQQHGSEEEERTEMEEGAMDNEPEGAAINLTKRFGGFLKGKYGYRKLMDPSRSMQKRYGVHRCPKICPKWNNQKRFSEFLKQYLGMNTRASEFNSVSADMSQQNEM